MWRIACFALALVLPACSSGETKPEAADPQPVAPKPVTVNVVGTRGKPVAGVPVYFHDAGGEILATTTSGADGKASSSGPVPAQVTVQVSSGLATSYLTWTSVEPGDVLLAPYRAAPDAVAGTLVATMAVANESDRGEQYSVEAYLGSCGGRGTAPGSAEIAVFEGCTAGPTADLLAVGRGLAFFPVFAFEKDVVLPTNGATKTVALGPWLPAADVVINVVNPPAGEGTQAFLVIGGVGFPTTSDRGTNPSSFKIPPGFADEYEVFADVRPADRDTNVYQRYESRSVTKRATAAASIDVDLARVLPRITTVRATSGPRPEVQWTSEAPADTDGGLVSLSWLDEIIPCAGPSCVPDPIPPRYSGSWVLIVAPGATSVKAPALPAEAKQGPWKTPIVELYEASAIADYAAFRRDAPRFTRHMLDPSRSIHAPFPGAGEMRIATSGESAP